MHEGHVLYSNCNPPGDIWYCPWHMGTKRYHRVPSLKRATDFPVSRAANLTVLAFFFFLFFPFVVLSRCLLLGPSGRIDLVTGVVLPSFLSLVPPSLP